MKRLYRDKDGTYYTLIGNMLVKVDIKSGEWMRIFSDPSVTHEACLAIGLVLVANNYKLIK